MYFESTALNGDAVSSENINTYSTVHANSSRSVYPQVVVSSRIFITITARITSTIGAIVIHTL